MEIFEVDKAYIERHKDELTPTFAGYMDDEGNIYEVVEDDDDDAQAKKPSQSHQWPAHREPDNRADPSYWYHFYDPRYCSGSREEYCQRMAAKYRNEG